jgi:hypothetical protein
MALVSADTSAEIKNITLDSFAKRHIAKPPARYLQPIDDTKDRAYNFFFKKKIASSKKKL